MLDSLLLVLETEEEKTLIEKLYNEYESQMYSVAYSILKHRQEAEDAVEIAFLKVIECLPRLHLGINMQTQVLLTIITRNTALNQIKKINKQLNHESYGENIESIHVAEIPGDLSYNEIKEFIYKLPDGLKNAVIMRYILGYSTEETANLLSISASAVYKRISAAKKLLVKFLEEQYDV